ncbi:MAG TPA: metallophosphoesterase [Solirubrobacteraceae bacterium]|nr:metallophosphoesterase [Solirubrobacteraceae bacterium]
MELVARAATQPTGPTRRLVLSDLHFGSGDELAHHPVALERIAPHLAWADEVLINGDLFELIFGPLDVAVQRSRAFFALVNRSVRAVRFIPGNHDHHFVSHASDERRLAAITGEDPGPAFSVPSAERVLRVLCPDVEVLTNYPVTTLDGVTYQHGHYIAPHVESFGWKMLDRLSWQLTGSQRPDRLSVADYEGLQAPLLELMYEMANLPQGVRAQQNFERWLVGAGAWMRAPTKATRQVSGLAAGLVRRNSPAELRENPDLPGEQTRAAMTAVCTNLDIAPGIVCFAHTHSPLAGVPSTDDVGRWRFYNSGSWMWDRRLREHPHYRATSWPGTALRVYGGEIELVELLSDLDERDLSGMVPPATGAAPAGERPRAAKAPRRSRLAALRATP